MIVVSGFLRFDAPTMARLRPAMEETVLATRAEAGCIVYAFSEDLAEPGLVRIYEEWDSADALDAHGRAEHILRWREMLAGATILERELKRVAIDAFEPFG